MADLSAGPGLVAWERGYISEASRVLFWLRVLAIESIDTVCFELLHAWGPPKRRFYSRWNSPYFSEIFLQRKLRIHAHSARRWEAIYSESVLASLALDPV